MSSSADHQRVAVTIEALLGRPPLGLSRVGGGGNNRLYRAEMADGPVAVKCYFRHPSDPRDRQAVEMAALTFLDRHGLLGVPRPIATDAAAGIAIQSWVEGTPIAERRDDDIDAMAAFAARLHELGRHPVAAVLPLASEACLSGAELVNQLVCRLARLQEAVSLDSELGDFITNILAPHIMAAQDTNRFESDLAPNLRTLSPSDFGTHNALRRSDGTLTFLDFEYFGWDDPVKLTADVLLHPGMRLSRTEQVRYLRSALRTYATDPAFPTRLCAFHPLISLRWALIVLNPFLPERWARQHFATGAEREHVLRTQLSKARHYAALDPTRLTAILDEANGP